MQNCPSLASWERNPDHFSVLKISVWGFHYCIFNFKFIAKFHLIQYICTSCWRLLILDTPEYVDSENIKFKLGNWISAYQLLKKRDFYFIKWAKIGYNWPIFKLFRLFLRFFTFFKSWNSFRTITLKNRKIPFLVNSK
jgi:hypothetical protein